MELIKKNKAVLKFLGIFFGSYLIFTLIYNYYLTHFSSNAYYPDVITHIVALQSQELIEVFGYTTKSIKSTFDPSMRIGINGTYLVRIVEGCNAVSVMILFFSFILAFKTTWKKTLLYILGGLAIIYALNIIRIALLTIALYKFPDYEHFLHGTLFPAVIYGTVFLLWFFWVKNFKPTQNEN